MNQNKITKDILESHAYHLFSSYKSRMQDSNKLSKAFDEEEAEFYDNIRVQLHQKAIKDEQEFRENTLMPLSKDMMVRSNRSIRYMESRFALLKDEYQQRFEALESRLVQEARLDREEIRLAKQELLELISKIEGEESTKINNIKKDLNQLTEDTNKDRLSNKSIFYDISKKLSESNGEKIKLSKKIDEVSSNLLIKIKSLEANDHNLLNRTKDLDKRLTFTNKDLSDSIISFDNLSKDHQNLKKTFKKYKVSIKHILNKFENKIDACSQKEITKSNDIFAEFKAEIEKQFTDLKNKQIGLKDEFEESKKNVNKVKEELNQEITSQISTFSADMKNNFDKIDIKLQNLLQGTKNLNIKIYSRTKTSGNINSLLCYMSIIIFKLSEIYVFFKYIE